jgi:ABC-type dipeptide/oligopeptide/nickel transport system permease component
MLNAYTYKSNWQGYIAKRVLFTVVAFLVITLLAYVALHGVWGPDQAVHILGLIATYKELPEMTVLMDKYTSSEGRITQYFQWLGDFFTGEWGVSIIREVPVKDLLF